MATIRLVPSSTGTNHTSYATVENPGNMYYNTDHTGAYASCRGRNRNSSTAYHIFINGFNFGSVPSNATVTSFSVKIKCYRSSNQRTGANYRLRLASQPDTGTVITNTTLSTDIATGTSGAIYTIPTGSLTWSQLSGYGSDFSVVVPVASTNGSYPYVYVFGVEIEVNYTVPMKNLTITNNSSTVTTYPTAGTTSVEEGSSPMVEFLNVSDLNSLTITDNNTDIKALLDPPGTKTSNLVPNECISHIGGESTQYPLSNGLTNSSSNTYAQLTFSVTSINMRYGFDVPVIPSNATNITVSCTVKGSRYNSSSVTGKIQLYAGDTAKGSAYNLTTTATATALTTGNWTATEVNNLVLQIDGTYTATSTSRYIRFYGADLTISYTLNGYSYTISNISADHTIVVSEASTGKTYAKTSTGWAEMQKIYKKVNGSWVEQTPDPSIFDPNEIYLRNI